jgi:hypothetical protein
MTSPWNASTTGGSHVLRNRPNAITTASNGSPSTVRPRRTPRTGVSNRMRSVTPNAAA